MRVTRLRASPRYGGAGRFLVLYGLLIRRGGVPSGAAAFITISKTSSSCLFMIRIPAHSFEFHQKIEEIYESHPLQGLSGARRGRKVSGTLWITDPSRGVPSGEAVVLLFQTEICQFLFISEYTDWVIPSVERGAILVSMADTKYLFLVVQPEYNGNTTDSVKFRGTSELKKGI